jgi:hypothetical protein
MSRERLLLLVLVSAGIAVGLGACGSDENGDGADVASDYGATPCKEMLREGQRLARTLEGEPVDLPQYGYLAVELDAPRETFLPGEENEGYATWLTYFCTKDESQTVAKAFQRGEEVVADAGGPAAAVKKYERVAKFQEQPP